jgi:GTP pyrophosphokinase
MDDIAEQGVAAHWKYKGITPEISGMERWLARVRETLEKKDNESLEFFDNFQPGNLISVLYVLHSQRRNADVTQRSYCIGFCLLYSFPGGKSCTGRQDQRKTDAFVHPASRRRPGRDHYYTRIPGNDKNGWEA